MLGHFQEPVGGVAEQLVVQAVQLIQGPHLDSSNTHL